VEYVNALETVTILVTAGAAVLAAVDYVRNGGPLSRLGREGAVWFDHLADMPLDQRPSEDALDAPIPRRPLVGRF
jgi:hypothetical protein